MMILASIGIIVITPFVAIGMIIVPLWFCIDGKQKDNKK
jgi:ABC-type Na+ efflux pump permease subunit